MKKLISIVLALVLAFSGAVMAFATEATDATEATEATTAGPLDAITKAFEDLFAKVKEVLAGLTDYLKSIGDMIKNLVPGGEGGVLGALDDFSAKVGESDIGGDLKAQIKGFVTSLKQKIKDLYAGNKETTIEETTAAEEPVETGSASAGLVVFAAVSAAAAAAYVSTKKKA